MSRIVSILNSLDLFGIGTPPPLNIKGKEKVHSCLGLLLTFLTVTFLTVIAIIIFVNFLHRSSPSVVQSSLKGVLQNEPFYINNENNRNNSFNFAFAVFSRDDGVWLIDPSYFTVQAIYTKFNQEDKTFSRRPMDIQLCPPGLFQKNSYCLSSVDPDGAPAQILGYTDITIDLVIRPCVTNSRSNLVCASREDINKKMGNSLLYVFREDWSINTLNYQDPINPIDPTKTAVFIALTSQNYKSIKLFLNKVEIVTDNGWLFENDIRQNVTTLEEYMLDFEERTSSQSPFAYIRLQTKCNKIVYNRKYIKVQDMLAQVDGLATFLVIVFCFVIMPYSRVKMQETLVNEAFKLGPPRAPPSSKSSIHPYTPKDQPESKGKESQKEAKYKSLTGINRSTSPDKSNEKKIDENSDQSILKLFKSQSHSGEQIQKGRKTREELNRRTCPPSFPLEIQQGSDKKQKYLLKSFLASDSNDPKIKNLELNQEELADIRQYQSSSTTPSSENEQKEAKEITLVTNTPCASQTQSLQSLQEQDILVTKESSKAVEIKIQLDENQDIEGLPPNTSTPRIEVSFCQWLLSFFKRSSQIDTLEKASAKLFKSLDLIALSRAIAELEIIKGILFSNEQRVLFENLSTPSLFTDQNVTNTPASRSSIEYGDWDDRTEWNDKDLEEAYQSVSQCSNKSSVDSKLLSLYRKKTFERKYSINKNVCI